MSGMRGRIGRSIERKKKGFLVLVKDNSFCFLCWTVGLDGLFSSMSTLGEVQNP
jgi:hypothetical protein